MGFGRKRKIEKKRVFAKKAVKVEKVVEQAFKKPVLSAKEALDKREVSKESNGFTMVFECWNCQNRIEKHYGRLEAVNSNSVGDCPKCGKKNPFEVVRRINDR